jgi:hypothetical protein
VHATVDGNSVVDVAFDARAVPTGTAPLVGIGIVYTGGPSGVSVRYDNVTITLR